MGKYSNKIIKKILGLRLHCYLLLWNIDRICYAALKMFKLFDSTIVDSSDDDDEMEYFFGNPGGETDW